MECGNKSKLTESDAWRRAKRLQGLGEATHAYRCPQCGHWHLGHDIKLSMAFTGGREEYGKKRDRRRR